MRIDKVKEYVLNNAQKGVTAKEVSEALNIQRSHASLELNELVNMGILEKTNTRPVMFYPKKEIKESEKTQELKEENNTKEDDEKKENDVFSVAIEKNPSLRSAFLLAKAAVTYPPHGLNTLITGETGVGKSYFAEKMWQYVTENDCFGNGKDKTPFVTFSCAEYADNPQLLLSQLFGHAKGAFTGANETKKGIVEEADNGILFLDEIHRLPPTGQELLFMLLDKGVLRRMGDKVDRPINVMIICATTEDINTSLLRTFTRRIPVTINIPNLSERSTDEKLNLIKYFLSIEAKRLNTPIWISGQALNFFLKFKPKANVGELRNVINLCCAKGYLNYVSSQNKNNNFIKINIYDLPQKVYQQSDKNLPEDVTCTNIFSEGLLVSSTEEENKDVKTMDEKYSINLYGYIDKRISSYDSLNIKSEEIPLKVSADLEKYYNNIINRLTNAQDEDVKLIDGILPTTCKQIANDVINFASLKLNRTYSKCISIALAMHIQQFINRSNMGEIIYNPNLGRIKQEHFAEMQILRELQDTISNKIGINITEDELGFWAMFLSRKKSEEISVPKIGLIVASHGNQTAKGMANFVNELMSTNLVHYIDAPINKSVSDIFDDLCDMITAVNEGKGVLLLVDMGSFTTIEEKLEERTGISVRIIPSVSSILVLESTKIILSGNENLDNLYKMVYHDYYQLITSQFNEGYNKQRKTLNNIKIPSKDNEKNVVISVCSTGIGSAAILKQIVSDIIEEDKNTEIKTLSITDDIQSIAAELGSNLKLIVGGINPEIKGIPFFGADYLLTKEGHNNVKRILGLSDNNISEKEDDEDIFEIIAQRCNVFAPSLNPDIAMELCNKLCEKVKNEIAPASTPENYYVNITLHFLCMLERLINNQIEELPTWGETMIKRNHDLYIKIKRILSEVCSLLDLKVPKSEVCYFLHLI